MAVIDIVYSHIFDSVFYFLLRNIQILDHIYCLVYYFLIVFMRNKVKFFKSLENRILVVYHKFDIDKWSFFELYSCDKIYIVSVCDDLTERQHQSYL